MLYMGYIESEIFTKDQHIFDLILQQLQNTVYQNKLSENVTLKESLANL
jgi:hypothetical protein